MLSRTPAAALGLALALPAQLASGPEAGAPLAPLTVYAPSGPRSGETFDAAAAIGTAPGVLLFVHELTRPTGQVIGGLDRFAGDYALLGLRTFTVRLAADRTEAESRVKLSSEALRLQNPIVISTDGAEGPGPYALNRKCTLTLVTCKDGKVVRSLGLTDTGRADLPKLREMIEEVAGALPADEAGLKALLEERLPKDPAALRELAVRQALELRRLRRDAERAAQDGAMRRDRPEGGMRGADSRPQPGTPPNREAPARQGRPPDDEQLRSLMNRIILPEAGTQELDAAFAEIDKRIGTDAALRAQASEGFKWLQTLRTPSAEARRRAREWLESRR